MWQRLNGLVLSVCLFGFQPMVQAEPLDLSTLLPPDDKSTEPAAENPDGTPTTPENEAAPTASESAPVASPTAVDPSPAATPIVPDQPGTLQMPKVRTSTIKMPGRGMKKSDVEARFGAPREKTEPVGKPPISSWIYKEFTVYFEQDTALHAVTNDP